MNEVTIGDKIYISAKRAAEITGYARDYVGQLCREGHVEARMVGRSWYVSEASVRAHRFGAVEDPVVEEEIDEKAAVESKEELVSTWERPVYTAETHEMIPEVQPAVYKEILPPAEETLTDMQEAWREWFDRKQQVLSVPEIESPEVIDARIEEHEAETGEEIAESAAEEVEIPLHRIDEELEEAEIDVYEPEEEAESITIHSIAPSPVRREVEQPITGRIVQERVVTRTQGSRASKRKGYRSNAPVTAVLLGISFVSLAVTAIGSGFADKYIQTFAAENPVINFLVGTNKFKR